MYVGTQVSLHRDRGQKTTSGSPFSLSTMCVLGIKLRSLTFTLLSQLSVLAQHFKESRVKLIQYSFTCQEG